MKKIYLATAVFFVLTSCQNADVNPGNTTGNTNSKGNQVTWSSNEATTPPPRDVTITPENSYSDLFLDSAAVEAFIINKKMDDATAVAIRNFYNMRNYQYAWLTTDGFTEQGRGFWNLYEYTSNDKTDTKNKAFDARMDTLIAEDSLTISPSDTSFADVELGLTQQFVHFAKNNAQHEFNNRSTLTQFIPAKKTDALRVADSLLKADTNSIAKANRPYNLLRQQLGKYYSIAQQGGWQPVTIQGKRLKKGTTSPSIAAIKKRLHLTGDMAGADTSRVFNDSLEAVIKSYQKRHGFRPDGVITDSLVKLMNIPVEQRLQQILVNMNRMYWMPTQLPDNRIEVNIPEFLLYVYEGKSKVFEMPVVVGKEGTNTMMFTGNLNQVVFSPNWNIPESIVRNEILPAMKKDPNYLKKKKMEIVKEGDSLPTIRQLPGTENSLGKVKFLFPNSYDIYFHDTQGSARSLFQKQKRAFSHGCIRLADAEKMANYLLRNQQEWDSVKIKQAMNAGNEQYVRVKNPIQVVITYFTAWVDENGQLNFRDDIYAHDGNTAGKMFLNSAFTNDSSRTTDTTTNRAGKDTAKRRANVL
ncbi:MAG: murein L,D-transpeptidase [Chitinophagaceae bacterium]